MKYKISPYHGYDCDSVSGFNNGCYLESIIVEVNSPEEAIEKAMDAYIESNNIDLSKVERGGSFGDFTLYSEGPVTDSDGNEVDTEADDFEFNEAIHSYRYEYIDFSSVESTEDAE